MADELNDQEIAERLGTKAPAATEEDSSKTSDAEEAKDEKEDEQEDQSESGDESEEDAEDEEEAEDEADDEEAEDEDEESDDATEEDEEDEDEPEDRGKQRTVPYSKLKSERAKRKELQSQIDSVVAELAKLRADKKGTDTEDEQDDLTKVADALAKELGQDSEGLTKVLRAAVDLAKRELGTVPKDLQEKLKLVDSLKKKEQETQEATHFNTEWGKVLPEIKKRFPNMSEGMVAEAKKVMDDLAHSKKYHRYDLDYILFKEGKRFENILKVAPKKRSGEESKRISDTDEETGTEDNVKIEDLTPEVMKKREREMIEKRSSVTKDPNMTIIEPLN